MILGDTALSMRPYRCRKGGFVLQYSYAEGTVKFITYTEKKSTEFCGS